MPDLQAGDTFRQPGLPGNDGQSRNNEAWGGHGFGYTTAPNGARQVTQNGYDDDTQRYKSMAQAAADAPTYQIDYGQADQDAGYGQQSRGMQSDAIDRMRGIANGTITTPAQLAGQQQLVAGLQAQQAGAMSARGGSLAQAAALRQQQSGQGAYMQSGNQQLDAQHAQEMAQARQQYMQATQQQRGQDQQNQGLQQQRADAQAQTDSAQRDLNDSTSMGYEQMGADVQGQWLKSQTSAYALAGQHDAARAAADQADQDRTTAKYAAVASAGGTFLPRVASGSDERMKQGSYMLSDDRTKLAAAWDEGHNEALNKVQQYRQMSPEELKALGAKGNRLANAVRGAKGDAFDEARGQNQSMTPSLMRQPTSFTREDPMTKQLAEGLAPHSYEYKPEFAAAEGQQPGEKNVGPMAQNMASNPVTGQAVSQRPDGLLQIDMKKATKLSLAAAGHNAQKIREQQAQIDALKGGR